MTMRQSSKRRDLIKTIVQTGYCRIVIEVLQEGTQQRLVRREMEEARKAGFATPEGHRAANAIAAVRTRDEQIAKNAARDAFNRGEKGGREAAEAAFSEMVAMIKQHPLAVRMTRKGDLLDLSEAILARNEQHEGLIPWLVQNGFRSTIDDRKHFFSAAKQATLA